MPKDPLPRIFFFIYKAFGSLFPFAMKTFESMVTTCLLSSEASFIILIFSSLVFSLFFNLSFVGCSLNGGFALLLLLLLFCSVAIVELFSTSNLLFGLITCGLLFALDFLLSAGIVSYNVVCGAEYVGR